MIQRDGHGHTHKVCNLSITLVESVDVNDIPQLAVVAIYFVDLTVGREVCCLKPMP